MDLLEIIWFLESWQVTLEEIFFGFCHNLLLLVAYATPDNKERYKSIIQRFVLEASNAANTTTVPNTKAPASTTPVINESLQALIRSNKLIDIQAAASSTGTLYAAMSAEQILSRLKDLNVDNIKDVVFFNPIKVIGDHKVQIDGVEVSIRVSAAPIS